MKYETRNHKSTLLWKEMNLKFIYFLLTKQLI